MHKAWKTVLNVLLEISVLVFQVKVWLGLVIQDTTVQGEQQLLHSTLPKLATMRREAPLSKLNVQVVSTSYYKYFLEIICILFLIIHSMTYFGPFDLSIDQKIHYPHCYSANMLTWLLSSFKELTHHPMDHPYVTIVRLENIATILVLA